MKNWYTYRRNGIIYVQFKDKITGKKLTARSTKTRDPIKAKAIINFWYYNQDSFFKRQENASNVVMLKRILENITIEQFNTTFQNIMIEKLSYVANQQSKILTPTKSYPPEINEIIPLVNDISFYDYLMLFWHYEESPFIKQLKRLGQKIPNPERFSMYRGVLKKYKHIFGDILLTQITVDNINTMLGQIKHEGNLQGSSICQARGIITQALKFAYKNKIITYDLSKGITTFSFKNKTKAIFSVSELQRMFADDKYFGNTKYLLFNKILFKTGCRCGEIQALTISDLEKHGDDYILNISKSTCRGGRIKETKTGRKDKVPISIDLAHEILAYIESCPYSNNKNAFIFCDKKNINKPLEYSDIYLNFKRAMKRLNIQKENLSLHSYRHTYTTILWDKGFSELDLLYVTRHDDINQIRRYGEHVTPAKEIKKKTASTIIDQIA